MVPWQIDGNFVPFPLLVNTILLVLAVACLAIPMGCCFAFLITRTNFRLARFSQTVVLVLLLIPAFIHVAAWDAGFGLQGWISRNVGAGVILLDGWTGAIWVYTMSVLPWVIFISGIFLMRVPHDLEEMASLEMPPLRVLTHVTFRYAFPGIVGAFLWICIVVANEVTITDVYQIRTYAEEVYAGFALGDTLQEAQARVLPGVLLVAAVGMAAYRLGTRLIPSEANPNLEKRFVFRVDRFQTVIFFLVTLALIVLLVVPIVNLCFKAGVTVTQTGDERIRSWSAIKLVAIVAESPGRFSKEIAWSLLLGQLAAVSSVAVALLLSWYRKSRWIAIPGALAAIAGAAIPGPILGLAVVKLLSQPQSAFFTYLYDDTIFAAWLVLTIRTFPFAYLLCQLAVRTIDRQILESAKVDGVSHFRQLLHIALPILAPQLIGAWLICLVWGMGELSATILAVPPGVTTLSIRIFNLVHYGVEDRLAGICLFQIIAFVPLAAIGLKMVRR